MSSCCRRSFTNEVALSSTLKEAYDEIEDEEDEHLYRTKGWCRELWLESLGLKAVLPPPEETQRVKTAIDAGKVDRAWKKESSNSRG